MKKYLLALLGFFFVVCSAHAGTYPAGHRYAVVASKAGYGSSPEAACADHAYQMGFTVHKIVAGGSYGICSDGVGAYNNNNYVTYPLWCPQGGTLSGSTCIKECGAGETLQPDGTCAVPCGPGQTSINGVCTCDNGAQTGTDGTCCPVSGSGGGAPMQWCYVDSPSATSCDSAGTNGCKVRCNNVTFQQGTGQSLTIWPKQALGQNCKYTGTRGTNLGGGPLNNEELGEVTQATTDPGKADTPEGCLASGQGYITGSTGTHCVPGGDTGVVHHETGTGGKSDGTTTESSESSEQTPTGGTETESTTTHNPDGTSTTTTTTRTCKEDGTCTTTTTTTQHDADGNTTDTDTDTNTESLSKFCQSNPNSIMCKGLSDECKNHPDRIGCMDAGDPGDAAELGTHESGLSAISPVAVGSNATCPADIQLPKGMSFSFGPFCDYASAFRPIIIALAWITAGFLVFGYRGNNG